MQGSSKPLMGVRSSHGGPKHMTNVYNNPFHSPEVNLEVAIGAIDFRDKTIANLRAQILNLRTLILADYAVETVEDLDRIQFSHLKLY